VLLRPDIRCSPVHDVSKNPAVFREQGRARGRTVPRASGRGGEGGFLHRAVRREPVHQRARACVGGELRAG
jgi:hypothetical protein